MKARVGIVRKMGVLICVLAVTILLPTSVWADRGAMSFQPWIEIYEPAQNAVIAWNGKEQLLLLSTDLKAAAPTKVLEVLPLPSSPVITRGDIQVFEKLNRLIRQHQSWDGYHGKGPETRGAAAEVTFHEKIGAHDIRVVHVLDGPFFAEWVIDYFRSQGIKDYKISPVVLATIEQYLLDGYKWFVFDVVELGTSVKTNDAIQYRFVSDKLYYPLRISGNAKGMTDIGLTIVTRQELKSFFGMPLNRFNRPHAPIPLRRAELIAIHEEMAQMFDSADALFLQTYQLRGDLAEFDVDVLAR